MGCGAPSKEKEIEGLDAKLSSVEKKIAGLKRDYEGKQAVIQSVTDDLNRCVVPRTLEELELLESRMRAVTQPDRTAPF